MASCQTLSFFKSSVDVFSSHGLVTRLPRRLMLWIVQELWEKIIMPELMVVCQGQWRAGPINCIIFQPDVTRMYPIFHHSTIPSFQSHDLEALDRLWAKRTKSDPNNLWMTIIPIFFSPGIYKMQQRGCADTQIASRIKTPTRKYSPVRQMTL